VIDSEQALAIYTLKSQLMCKPT